MITFLVAAACSLVAEPSAHLDLLGPLTEAQRLPAAWTVKAVRGQKSPEYSVVADADGARWRIAGSGTAAWAVRKLDAPRCDSAGVLTWSWRVLQRPDRADLRAEHTDDSPVRLFVIFGKPPGPFGGSGRILFYTWGGREPEGFAARSFPSSKAHVLRMAGDGELGEAWREERVQPFADFQRIWGGTPPPITAIGVLQDTDATGQAAVAEFRRIVWRSGDQGLTVGAAP